MKKRASRHVYCPKENEVLLETSKQLSICEYCDRFRNCFPEYFYSDSFGNILKITPILHE